MSDTLVIEEPRSVVDRFRNWYKEKYIDTGKAKKFEERLDKRIEIEKKLVYVVGSIATIVLIFVPADGPVGEVLAAAATPLLAQAVELKGKLTKDLVLGGKRKLEADFIRENGSSEKVEVPEFNFEEIKNDVINTKDAVTEYAGIFNKDKEGGKTL